MTVIPQRDLRNKSGEILRRAEQGEQFTITVSGRPVAELGPMGGARDFASWETLNQIIRENPVDAEWAAELQQMRDEELEDSIDVWAG